jgi:hypothetical protein
LGRWIVTILVVGALVAAPYSPAVSETRAATTCAYNVLGSKVSSSAVGGQGFSDCWGDIISRTHTLYVDKCLQDFVICWVWSSGWVVATGYKAGQGVLWTPTFGIATRYGLPAGRYRTRMHYAVNTPTLFSSWDDNYESIWLP